MDPSKGLNFESNSGNTNLAGHDPAKPVTDAQYESVYTVPFRAAAVFPVCRRSESLGGRAATGL